MARTYTLIPKPQRSVCGIARLQNRFVALSRCPTKALRNDGGLCRLGLRVSIQRTVEVISKETEAECPRLLGFSAPSPPGNRRIR
jgi:hypothetical protein